MHMVKNITMDFSKCHKGRSFWVGHILLHKPTCKLENGFE
jgi:hypothetical protein